MTPSSVKKSFSHSHCLFLGLALLCVAESGFAQENQETIGLENTLMWQSLEGKSKSVAIERGKTYTLSIAGVEVHGAVSDYTDSMIYLDSRPYALNTIDYFRKGRARRAIAYGLLGVGAAVTTLGVVHLGDENSSVRWGGVSIEGNPGPTIVRMGLASMILGATFLPRKKYRLGTEGYFITPKKEAALEEVEPTAEVLLGLDSVPVTSMDTLALLISLDRGSKRIETLLAVADPISVRLKNGIKVKGFITDLSGTAVQISQQWVSMTEIDQLKIPKFKRRYVAGGIVMGVGLASVIGGASIVKERYEDDVSYYRPLIVLAGAVVVAVGVAYFVVGSYIMRTTGYMTVATRNIEFTVLSLPEVRERIRAESLK